MTTPPGAGVRAAVADSLGQGARPRRPRVRFPWPGFIDDQYAAYSERTLGKFKECMG